MKSVFISGSIKIKTLPTIAIKSINNIIKNEFSILLGDAYGIDYLVQSYLDKKSYFNVNIYSITDPPRNIASEKFSKNIIDYKNMDEYIKLSEEEKTRITFSEKRKQSLKDIAMVKKADFLLVIWNGESEGSKNNIIRGINLNKKIKVILNSKIVPQENINLKFIENIYEENRGIGIKELKSRLNQELGEGNIPSNNLLKKCKYMEKIYPFNSKTFLQGIKDYNEYLITSFYKGKEKIKYKPSIINKLKSEILIMESDFQRDNTLFKIMEK